MGGECFSAHENCWSSIRAMIERLQPRQLVMAGYARHGSSWLLMTNPLTKAGFFTAIRFFAENQLHIRNVTAVRVGVGVKTYGRIHGYSSAVVLLWKIGEHSDYHTIEQTSAVDGSIPAVRLNTYTDDWPEYRSVQLLCRGDNEPDPDRHRPEDPEPNGTQAAQETAEPASDGLSTIPEGDEAADQSDEDESLLALTAFIAHDDAEKHRQWQRTTVPHCMDTITLTHENQQ